MEMKKMKNTMKLEMNYNIRMTKLLPLYIVIHGKDRI
jgi:hypothetical protein